PIDRDEGRQFHPEAIFDVGRAQFALLDRDLAVLGRGHQPHRRQWASCAVLADGGKNSGVNVRVWLAFDFPLLDAALLGKGQGRQREQRAECGQCPPCHCGLPDALLSYGLNGLRVLWAISTSRKNSAVSRTEMKNPASAPAIEIGALGISVMMPTNIGVALASQASPASAPAIVATTMKINARICATKMTTRRTAAMLAPSLLQAPPARTLTSQRLRAVAPAGHRSARNLRKQKSRGKLNHVSSRTERATP